MPRDFEVYLDDICQAISKISELHDGSDARSICPGQQNTRCCNPKLGNNRRSREDGSRVYSSELPNH